MILKKKSIFSPLAIALLVVSVCATAGAVIFWSREVGGGGTIVLVHGFWLSWDGSTDIPVENIDMGAMNRNEEKTVIFFARNDPYLSESDCYVQWSILDCPEYITITLATNLSFPTDWPENTDLMLDIGEYEQIYFTVVVSETAPESAFTFTVLFEAYTDPAI